MSPRSSFRSKCFKENSQKKLRKLRLDNHFTSLHRLLSIRSDQNHLSDNDFLFRGWQMKKEHAYKNNIRTTTKNCCVWTLFCFVFFFHQKNAFRNYSNDDKRDRNTTHERSFTNTLHFTLVRIDHSNDRQQRKSPTQKEMYWQKIVDRYKDEISRNQIRKIFPKSSYLFFSIANILVFIENLNFGFASSFDDVELVANFKIFLKKRINASTNYHTELQAVRLREFRTFSFALFRYFVSIEITNNRKSSKV